MHLQLFYLILDCFIVKEKHGTVTEFEKVSYLFLYLFFKWINIYEY